MNKRYMDTRAPDSMIISIILPYKWRVWFLRVTRTIFNAMRSVAETVVIKVERVAREFRRMIILMSMLTGSILQRSSPKQRIPYLVKYRRIWTANHIWPNKGGYKECCALSKYGRRHPYIIRQPDIIGHPYIIDLPLSGFLHNISHLSSHQALFIVIQFHSILVVQQVIEHRHQ